MEIDNKSKKIKYHIVDYLENLCNKSKISNKTIGTYIRGWHIWAPFAMLIGVFRDTYMVCVFYLVAQFMLLIGFYIFDGCLLTSLERRLCGDTFTFIDPCIEVLGLEKNNDTRYYISLIVAFFYICLTIGVMKYRFLL